MHPVCLVGDLLGEPGSLGEVVFCGLLISGAGSERGLTQAQAAQQRHRRRRGCACLFRELVASVGKEPEPGAVLTGGLETSGTRPLGKRNRQRVAGKVRCPTLPVIQLPSEVRISEPVGEAVRQ